MRFINLIVPLVLELLIGVSASLHKPNCPNNDIIWEVESSPGTATLICTGCRQTGIQLSEECTQWLAHYASMNM
ncbi:hypothetical protein PGT21_025660 [Puccinia graminis f. sp. tritici]|uniref:Uncharacterized protein n=1 Tax=Puccinia graminis f. sp. tritici TaxID=56615 RepID=A0A5B0MX28_PUCGR|nr:hypothetical protein PGT21_025660 [Puccinia graminis f. sp. tritici]KAA1131091.1 hypothetical protein PGTUg99_004340 [Puccinia graminis f. sp. tritici]